MAIIKEFLKGFLFLFLTVGILELVCVAPIPGTMPPAEATEQWWLVLIFAVGAGVLGGVRMAWDAAR